MTRSTTGIIFDVLDQTIEYRCIQGRPTSATFDVLSDSAGDDDVPEFAGSATVDSVSTTVDVACGASSADPQQVKIAATTSIVLNRKYLLSEAGKQEWVEVIEIVSADSVRVRHPLRNDYTTAATFVGTHLTAAVDNTWVIDEANLGDQIDPNPSYRVRWRILVGGVTTVAYSFFDLVLAAVTHQIDLSDLNERAPGLVDSCPMDYRNDQGKSLIESAWRSVRARLAAMSIDTAALRDDSITDELTILRALNMLARGGWRPQGFDSLADYITTTQQEYDRFIEQHFQVVQIHKMAAGSTGMPEPVRQFVIGK